nr:MAG TPA: hypothetical protein [Caudoviricetes sp.]
MAFPTGAMMTQYPFPRMIPLIRLLSSFPLCSCIRYLNT